MGILILNGNDFYNAIISGAHNIINNRKYLNKINVFPVADGDTGTNMAYMMQSIINQAKPSINLSETLESISSAALIGSRGNSGIIFSEYLFGIHEQLIGKKTAKLDEFKMAVKNGIKKAYHAIMDPVEGTILTVLRKSSDNMESKDDFLKYFEESLKKAKIALKETTEELEVLKRNKVVDAGAHGFTAFLEGIFQYFKTGKTNTLSIPLPLDNIEIIHDIDILERFCTEAIIINSTKNNEQIMQIFKNLGSSLIVSGDQNKMKLHIHTDYPEKFFLELNKYGKLIEQKVDDMLRQKQAMAQDKPKIAIVTDSIADIPLEIMDMYQIHLLPVNLLLDDISYLDKVSITTNTFYDLLKKAKSVSSSQPSSAAIERSLEFLTEHYQHIIVITVASKLSGTYNAIKQYAKDNQKITVFDSKQNSGAEGLVVYEAARLVQTISDPKEIINFLEDFTSRTNIYVSIKTLKYMVRQGRISKVSGLIGKIANLKPVISLDKNGAGIIKAKSFSLHGNQRQILKLLQASPILSYCIVHSLDLNRASKMQKKIEKLTGIKPLYTTLISPIVSMNAGIGAVAVAVTFKEQVK